jgi:hypothetical protein
MASVAGWLADKGRLEIGVRPGREVCSWRLWLRPVDDGDLDALFEQRHDPQRVQEPFSDWTPEAAPTLF